MPVAAEMVNAFAADLLAAVGDLSPRVGFEHEVSDLRLVPRAHGFEVWVRVSSVENHVRGQFLAGTLPSSLGADFVKTAWVVTCMIRDKCAEIQLNAPTEIATNYEEPDDVYVQRRLRHWTEG